MEKAHIPFLGVPARPSQTQRDHPESSWGLSVVLFKKPSNFWRNMFQLSRTSMANPISDSIYSHSYDSSRGSLPVITKRLAGPEHRHASHHESARVNQKVVIPQTSPKVTIFVGALVPLQRGMSFTSAHCHISSSRSSCHP